MKNEYTIKINKHGDKRYYKNGVCHRDGDLPAIEYANGGGRYYKNNKLHRDGDLPAIECTSGNKYYYKNGKLHRDNGLPAVEYVNGDKEYWIDGNYLTEEEYYIKICKERNIPNKYKLIYYLYGLEEFVRKINAE